MLEEFMPMPFIINILNCEFFVPVILEIVDMATDNQEIYQVT